MGNDARDIADCQALGTGNFVVARLLAAAGIISGKCLDLDPYVDPADDRRLQERVAAGIPSAKRALAIRTAQYTEEKARAKAMSTPAFTLGDVSIVGDLPPGGKLLVQLNRFAAAKKFGTTIYRGADLASGNIPAGAAYTAAIIYQTRLLVAQAGIADAGTAAAIAAVNSAMAKGTTPQWLASNLPAVTDVVKGYADSLGLPNWADGGIADSLPTVAIVAAIGIGALLFFNKGRS